MFFTTCFLELVFVHYLNIANCIWGKLSNGFLLRCSEIGIKIFPSLRLPARGNPFLDCNLNFSFVEEETAKCLSQAHLEDSVGSRLGRLLNSTRIR